MGIKLVSTNKEFSQFGGLFLGKKILESSQFINRIQSNLPRLKSGLRRSQIKAEQLILGFTAGAECLDDMNLLSKDKGVQNIFDNSAYTAKSHGNFLRSFSGLQAKQINDHMSDMAYFLRQQIAGQNERFVLDLDSTENKQYGKKMEGYEKNYKGTMGLDTIVAFDELGFEYYVDVRPGATYTSHQAEMIIHEVFKRMPQNEYYKGIRKYFRADSGFCNSNVMKACFAKMAKFVIAMKANIYNPLIHLVKDWTEQNPKDEDRIKFYDGRECEIGSCLYYPEKVGKPLQVVFIRAPKEDLSNCLFKTDDDYDYFAWITNITEAEMSFDSLIKFYRGRGQAENYIKEMKYGFDLKHYPCKSLVANKVYAAFAGVGANIVRFMSLFKGLQAPPKKRKNKKKPSQKIRYSKLARFFWIRLPCQVVQHARQVEFRFSHHIYKEVDYWIKALKTLQLVYT